MVVTFVEIVDGLSGVDGMQPYAVGVAGMYMFSLFIVAVVVAGVVVVVGVPFTIVRACEDDDDDAAADTPGTCDVLLFELRRDWDDIETVGDETCRPS